MFKVIGFILLFFATVLSVPAICQSFTYEWNTPLKEERWLPYLNGSLPGDYLELYALVRDSIAFDAYAGSLRGAAGTALARSGNSIDQALLLKHLLDKRNMQSRLVVAELTTEQQKQLMTYYLKVLRERRQILLTEMSYEKPEFAYAQQEGLSFIQQRRKQQLELLETLVSDVENKVLAKLPEVQRANNTNVRQQEKMIAQDLRLHVWLQVKMNNGQWQHLDPSLNYFDAGGHLSESFRVVTEDDLALWKHHIKISIDADFIQEGEIKTKTLINLATDSQTLYGQPVLVVHPMKDSMYASLGRLFEANENALSTITSGAAGGIPFGPILQISDQYFEGDFLMQRGWKPAQFFAQPPKPELVAERICFAVSYQNEEEQYCRSLLDRRVPENTGSINVGQLSPMEYTKEVAPKGLAGLKAFAFMSGDIPLEFSQNQIQFNYPSDLSDEDPLTGEDRAAEMRVPQITNAKELGDASGAIPQTLFAIEQRMRASWRNGEAWGSIHKPNILGFNLDMGEVEDRTNPFYSLDIISTHIRIPENGQWWKDGIVRSAIETVQLAYLDSMQPGATENLFSLDLHIQRQDTDALLVIKTAEDLNALPLNAAHRQVMQDQLAQGIIVTPKLSWRQFHSWLWFNKETFQSVDTGVNLSLWPSFAMGAAMKEYDSSLKVAKNRGAMRMADKLKDSFCKLVQCSSSVFDAIGVGAKVWGRASIMHIAEAGQAAQGVISDCMKVRLRVKVPKSRAKNANHKWFETKEKAYSQGTTTPPRSVYEERRGKSPASLKGGESAGTNTDWDHTTELACGGDHTPDNIEKMDSSMNRWFGSTLGAACGMLCEGTEITGVDFYTANGKRFPPR